MYIMAPELISTVYVINPSHQYVSVCVSVLSLLGKHPVKCTPPFIDRQRLEKHAPAAVNTRNNVSILGACICVPPSVAR
jgi:hypothetical protein